MYCISDMINLVYISWLHAGMAMLGIKFLWGLSEFTCPMQLVFSGHVATEMFQLALRAN